jgi:hypothetical protein
MIASRRDLVLTAALSALLTSGSAARVVEAFDLSEVPYADEDLSEGTGVVRSLSTLAASWRDDRDPMHGVWLYNRTVCGITVGGVLRCWFPPPETTRLRDVLASQPWVRRGVVWHSFDRGRNTACAFIAATRAVECIEWHPPQQPTVRRWRTADSVFELPYSVCARTGAHVECLEQRFEMTLPSADGELVDLFSWGLCVRVGSFIECNAIDNGPAQRPAVLVDPSIPLSSLEPMPPLGDERCDVGVYSRAAAVQVTNRLWLPWRSAIDRKGMLPVVLDPHHPERLGWRRVDRSWPFSTTGPGSCVRVLGGLAATVGFYRPAFEQPRFKPDLAIVYALGNRAALVNALTTRREPVAWMDFGYIDRANARTLRESIAHQFGFEN